MESHDGLYYRKWRDKARNLVSEDLRKKIIQRVHTEYAHIGTSQMLATIHPHYSFPNLDKLVHEFCRKCQTSLENKVRR